MMKLLWSSIQGDPKFMRRVNGWLTIFWLAMIPVSLITGWVSSVVYVSAVVVGARLRPLVSVASRPSRGGATRRR